MRVATRSIWVLFIVWLSLVGPASGQAPAPKITGFTPTASGNVGDVVTISGSGFGTIQGTSTVTFGATAATGITSWGDAAIKAAVPSGATTGNVVVKVGDVSSNGEPFTVTTTPSITGLKVFVLAGQNLKQQSFVVEVIGANFTKKSDMRVIMFPGAGIDSLKILDSSDTSIHVEFSAPQNYKLAGVALSYSDNFMVSSNVDVEVCTADNVLSQYQVIDNRDVRNSYGNGVAKSFYVIHIQITNDCTSSIVVPLASIQVFPTGHDTPIYTMLPHSIDYVTGIYSTDRKLTGTRAIFFNSILAAATLGSAIEPFFGHGFTQAVSILGGGFTQAADTVLRDMSVEQLQNLASQSFGNNEQAGPNGGSINKFLFIPNAGLNSTQATALCDPKQFPDKVSRQKCEIGIEIHFPIIPTLPSTGTGQSTPGNPPNPPAPPPIKNAGRPTAPAS